MDGSRWIAVLRSEYCAAKKMYEQAATQLDDTEFFASVGKAPSSPAMIMKHVAGNLRSRWRNFLTEDGEKDDRNRESEFDAGGETRDSILEAWEDAWALSLEELDQLSSEDLQRSVTIRGEKLEVVQALQRNLAHVHYHCGQLIQLARQHRGDAWVSLSIPAGKSESFNEQMRERHGDWNGGRSSAG